MTDPGVLGCYRDFWCEGMGGLVERRFDERETEFEMSPDERYRRFGMIFV